VPDALWFRFGAPVLHLVNARTIPSTELFAASATACAVRYYAYHHFAKNHALYHFALPRTLPVPFWLRCRELPRTGPERVRIARYFTALLDIVRGWFTGYCYWFSC